MTKVNLFGKRVAVSGYFSKLGSIIRQTKSGNIIESKTQPKDRKPDRNSQCKCGSGKKFKKCCINKQKL